MEYPGNPVHSLKAHGRSALAMSTTIGEIVRLGAAVVQLGIVVTSHVMWRGRREDECHGGRGRHGGGGCACCSVCVHQCVECRPRVYPRGCCQ